MCYARRDVEEKLSPESNHLKIERGMVDTVAPLAGGPIAVRTRDQALTIAETDSWAPCPPS